MIISTPVSLGELVDKISILHIKNEKIKVTPVNYYAKTKYLAFIDSDAYQSKGWLESNLKLIENKKNLSQYTLTEPQVNSILELRLQKLTALGINEIEVEIKKLAELITNFKIDLLK